MGKQSLQGQADRPSKGPTPLLVWWFVLQTRMQAQAADYSLKQPLSVTPLLE